MPCLQSNYEIVYIMEATIIRIGNSKGIRIPKNILNQYNIKKKINLILEQDYIIIKPIEEPRKGWDKAFKDMHENGDDSLVIQDIFDNENFQEWN